MCPHVCMCVICRVVYVCKYRHTCLCRCVWTPEVHVVNLSLVLSPLFFFLRWPIVKTRVYHYIQIYWSASIEISRLCLCLPWSLGNMLPCLAFIWVQRARLRSLWLCGKYFAYRVASQSYLDLLRQQKAHPSPPRHVLAFFFFFLRT